MSSIWLHTHFLLLRKSTRFVCNFHVNFDLAISKIAAFCVKPRFAHPPDALTDYNPDIHSVFIECWRLYTDTPAERESFGSQDKIHFEAEIYIFFTRS